jgi:hypothetical protein
MAGRDDFGSNAGRPGGFGGAGGLANGGIGGGMGGGLGGGGAGRNGGIGSRTGLTTGNTMFGGMAFGRPGGPAMNSSAWGIRPQPAINQGPLSGVGRPRPAAVAGVNPVPEDIPALEDVPMPPATPNVFNQDYLGKLAGFRTMMNNRYGWGAAQPGPGPMAPARAASWRNPTAFPQFSTGWKNQTDNYSQGNTYPGGLNYTRELGRDNTWSNDDNRFGIDKMARERGY